MRNQVLQSENKFSKQVLLGVNLKNQPKRQPQLPAEPMKQIDMNRGIKPLVTAEIPIAEKIKSKIQHKATKNSRKKNSTIEFSEEKPQKIESNPKMDSTKSSQLRDYIVNFQNVEAESQIDKFYLLRGSKNLRPETRKTLFLWVSAVSYRGFRESIEFPLFETMRILDLFLSRARGRYLSYRDLQKIALTSLVISSEFEDCRYAKFKSILPEILNEMKDVCSESDIIHWSHKISKAIVMDSKQPQSALCVNCHNIYKFVAGKLGLIEEAFYFGSMLLELAMLDHLFLRYRQSTIGISCACLVLDFFVGADVSKIITELDGCFDPEEIRRCGKELAQVTLPENIIDLVQEKYLQDSHLGVGRFSFAPQANQLMKRSKSLS